MHSPYCLNLACLRPNTKRMDVKRKTVMKPEAWHCEQIQYGGQYANCGILSIAASKHTAMVSFNATCHRGARSFIGPLTKTRQKHSRRQNKVSFRFFLLKEFCKKIFIRKQFRFSWGIRKKCQIHEMKNPSIK